MAGILMKNHLTETQSKKGLGLKHMGLGVGGMVGRSGFFPDFLKLR